ncbi:MAG TPA: hypothetical protein PLY05_07760, partial [Agitococcus sp.]|nr:hypothetical protein [Agitococcus sp.]
YLYKKTEKTIAKMKYTSNINPQPVFGMRLVLLPFLGIILHVYGSFCFLGRPSGLPFFFV